MTTYRHPDTELSDNLWRAYTDRGDNRLMPRFLEEKEFLHNFHRLNCDPEPIELRLPANEGELQKTMVDNF